MRDNAAGLDELFGILNNARMKTKKVDALWSHLHWLGVLQVEGSFTAAAARLGVSKAAVSYRIAELEQATGLLLVRRTTRSVRLTEAALQLVASTRDAFVQIEQGFSSVRDLSGEPAGSVRVTAPVALGRQHIVPHMTSFLKAYPGIQLQLELSDRLSSLADEGFDLAIRHVEAVPDTHVAWTLCPTESVLVASEAYLAEKGVPRTPADLAQHNCLHYMRGATTPVWSFEKPDQPGERVSVSIRGTFTANNSETLRELALADCGIALMPDFSASQALAAGTLRRVLPDWRSVGAFGGQIYAIRPYSVHVPRAVQLLVAHLRETMQAGFPV